MLVHMLNNNKNKINSLTVVRFEDLQIAICQVQFIKMTDHPTDYPTHHQTL